MLVCAGCVKLGESSELPLTVTEATPTPVDRISCAEILGTAYRSDNERQWFMENCSKWPLVNVPDEPSVAAPPPAAAPNEPAECAQIRGKPYESGQQRAWYLQNCNQGSAPPSAQAPIQGSQPQSQASNQPGSGDRTDCNAIRGTSYRSASERAWYQQNCLNSTPLVTSGPDRTDCAAIRGTTYRSENERNWFISNCRT